MRESDKRSKYIESHLREMLKLASHYRDMGFLFRDKTVLQGAMLQDANPLIKLLFPVKTPKDKREVRCFLIRIENHHTQKHTRCVDSVIWKGPSRLKS
jgi:hypothetical protein